jgi:hypothetical protein
MNLIMWYRRNTEVAWMLGIYLFFALVLSVGTLTAHAQKPEVLGPIPKHPAMEPAADGSIPGLGLWIEQNCRALKDGHIKCRGK